MATCSREERESVQAQNVCQVDDEEPQTWPPRGAAQKERGGYECDFVQRPSDIFQTECSICLQVLKEPHIISCCGHSFCKLCIKRVEKDGKSCPLCNEAEFSLMHNKGLERSLRELEVYCTNRKVGCEWVGKLGVLTDHLNINPEPEKQLEGCGIVETKCVHTNCMARYQRRFLGNHQTECPKRPFSCDYCREYESTFEDVAYNHYPVCKCYPLSCPNNCTPDTIERQNLQRHLDKDCPLQVVPCDFQYAGCEATLPRKDMPAHLAENFTHITLLAVLNQRLAQKNDDMAARLLEKDEQIRRLTEEFRREMEAKQTEITELKHEHQVQYQLLRNEVDQLMKYHASSVAKTEFNKLKVQFKKGAVPKSEFDKLKRDVVSKTQLTEKVNELREEHKAALQKLHHHIHIAPAQITMSNFEQHKTDSDEWCSDPFYTHPHGYAICLRVCANGNGDGMGTHVSVFVCVARGEFDNHLKWPFQGLVTIRLLNQLDNRNHYEQPMNFINVVDMNRVTNGERAKGRGLPQFIAHTKLNQSDNCQYLKNDCLMFLVEAQV